MTTVSAGRSARRTRGGHVPTGTSAGRRAKASNGASAKGERTRASLIAAARRVFERVGYLDARVSDIVAEADIAHGSYYTYFPSKKAVFQAVSAAAGAEIDAAVGHSQTDVLGDTFGNLHRANCRYLDAHRANHKILVLMEQVSTIDPEVQAHRAASRRRHVNRLASMIIRLQERGEADPMIDAHTTAGALVAMISSFAHWTTMYPEDYGSIEETVTSICARAIGLRSDDRGATVKRSRASERESKPRLYRPPAG